MAYVEITTRVVPASREALECFPRSDLRDYAKTLEVLQGPQGYGGPTKEALIDALLASGKATLCASLGD